MFLGEGNVDFDQLLASIVRINYQGPLIFQAYRDENGVDIFKKQLEWFRNKIKMLEYNSEYTKGVRS